MLAFFSVGFLAGSFERAAGLGDPQLAQRRPSHVAAAFSAAPVAPPATPAAAPDGPPAGTDAASVRGEPLLRDAVGEIAPPIAHRAFVRPLQLDAGAGDAAETLRDLEASPPDLRIPAIVPRRPMSLPRHADWSPMPAPTFAAARDGVLIPGVPASQIVEALRPGRQTPVAAAPEFILPIDRGRVTSMFNQGRYHPAIDLAAPLGTPVHATTRKQKVTFAGRRGGYGNLVVTRDPSGREHYYGHLQRIVAGIGALLEQGDLLGLLGSTGHSTGPHVHYEVRTRAGGRLDPAGLLFPSQRVTRGYAWNNEPGSTRLAARSGQPRPR